MLQYIQCKKCGKEYMVGLFGKSTRGKELDGGHFEGTPYIVVGCGELKGQPQIKEGDKVPCPECGARYIVRG